jgi:hypothetical protein
MLWKNMLVASTVMLFCAVSLTNGAIGMINGGDSGLWDRGAYFLVVARVVEVRAVVKKDGEREDATHILTLEPICTLAGVFDPSRQRQFEARLAAYPNSSSVHEAPAKDSLIMVVILTAGADDDPHVLPVVTPEICTFMPDKSALVAVHDLNDKLITETAKRVRDARAREKAATQPSGRESGKSRRG